MVLGDEDRLLRKAGDIIGIPIGLNVRVGNIDEDFDLEYHGQLPGYILYFFVKKSWDIEMELKNLLITLYEERGLSIKSVEDQESLAGLIELGQQLFANHPAMLEDYDEDGDRVGV